MNFPPLESMIPEEARRFVLEQSRKSPESAVSPAKVENRLIDSGERAIPVRIYSPPGTGPFPILVYIHGGGWVVCNLDTHDEVCRSMCHRAECVVVSIDYCLSPEYPFPSAVEEVYRTMCWIADRAHELDGDGARIAIGGDSAGGNLSTVTALLARDRGGPQLAFQLLIYPVTDLHAMETESYRSFADGYYLTRAEMEWFRGHYLASPEDAKSPLASPLLAEDLSGLPSAFVLTAEYDPLRDEGEDYAKRLHKAGVDVQCVRYNGMIHAFWSMAGVFEQTQQAHQEAAAVLREVFRRSN